VIAPRHVNVLACAHAHVKLIAEGNRAWWECEVCGIPFAPVPKPVAVPGPAQVTPASDYLSIDELARRIPYRPGTIRNLMTQGKLRRDVHCVKKNNGRVMFLWGAMKAWVEEDRMKAG